MATNYLNFCMMATMVAWVNADRLKINPERRHKVKGANQFFLFRCPTHHRRSYFWPWFW